MRLYLKKTIYHSCTDVFQNEFLKSEIFPKLFKILHSLGHVKNNAIGEKLSDFIFHNIHMFILVIKETSLNLVLDIFVGVSFPTLRICVTFSILACGVKLNQ